MFIKDDIKFWPKITGGCPKEACNNIKSHKLKEDL